MCDKLLGVDKMYGASLWQSISLF